jgi:hypothetical protein
MFITGEVRRVDDAIALRALLERDEDSTRSCSFDKASQKAFFFFINDYQASIDSLNQWFSYSVTPRLLNNT